MRVLMSLMLVAVVYLAFGRVAGSAGQEEEELSKEEKTHLHKLARGAIEHRLLGKPMPSRQGESPRLAEKRGAFVTLKKRGELRGCIGYTQQLKPLTETVIEMAQAAAFQDPRFAPLSAREWGNISIEISALTPLRLIQEVKEIQVGKHGLFIERGGLGGLLLPQVATEYHWDRQTFLEHTCKKAGLPRDAWKDKKTRIYVFSAEIF